ncbi:MAG: hypothetical protein ABH877_05345, partial [bacterium]
MKETPATRPVGGFPRDPSRESAQDRSPDRPRRGRRLWLLAALALALLAAFLWIAFEVKTGTSLAAWDGRVTDALVSARTAG